MKRPGTQNKQFVQRIPADVKAKVRGMTLALPLGTETITMKVSQTLPDIRLSLRTADPVEAKARQAAIAAHLDGIWRAVRAGPRELSHKETIALAGEWYREMVAEWSSEPGRADSWAELRDMIVDAQLDLEREDTPENWNRLDALIQPGRFLASRSVLLAEMDAQRFVREAGKALTQAAGTLQRNAEGDYSPDPGAARFPEWTPSSPTAAPKPSPSAGRTSVLDLLNRLATERAYAPKTVSEWTRSLNSLTAHAGTTDAAAITPDHIIAWMDDLVAKGLSAKTINETYLAAVKALFRWAKGKRYLPSNPALETPKVQRRDEGVGKRGFTLPEAQVVLRAALAERAPVRRWVPWLLAYSGARAGEVMQLRPQDVRQDAESGIWCIDITPAAGPLKNRMSARMVPLHPHLIEMGFLDWAQGQTASRLFYEERTGEAGDGRRSRKSVAINRLADWVRQMELPGVLSGEVSPNHGWRHRFTTELVNLGVIETIRKCLTGHSLLGQDNRYVGRVAIERLHEAVARLPAYATMNQT